MATPGIPNWQSVLLNMLGYKETPQNDLFLTDWSRAEGGSAANNPFNTTQPGFNATGNYNSVGVKNYADALSGLRATANTLKNGRYQPILDSLSAGNNARASAQALANSPWGTGSLVLKMLGGAPTASNPRVVQAAKVAAQSPQQPSQSLTGGNDRRTALLSYLSSSLGNYAKTGKVGSDPMLLQTLLNSQQQPIAPAMPIAAPKKGAAPILPAVGTGTKIVGIPGTSYQANSAIIPRVESIIKNFGVRVSSGYRSPEHNAEVGGAEHSDHLTGNAIDFAGTPEQMTRLYNWAQGKFPYIEPMSQAKDHVHISFIR